MYEIDRLESLRPSRSMATDQMLSNPSQSVFYLSIWLHPSAIFYIYIRDNKQINQLNQTQMKPQNGSQLINTANPSLDLSKYKFIPPSRILKTQHHQSMKEPERTEYKSQAEESASPLKINRNFNKKRINKENREPPAKNDTQTIKSVSQPKLKHNYTSTKPNIARMTDHSFLNCTHKHLKCKTEYYEHGAQSGNGNSNQHLEAHINKLNQHISEIKAEAEIYACRIQKLTQQNKLLLLRIQQSEKASVDKNKIMGDLNKKIKEYEHQASQKCHEHTLIIDSLSNSVEYVEKIIDSQKNKISELEVKIENMNFLEDSALADDYYNASELYNKEKYSREPWSQRHLLVNHKPTTPDFGTGTPEDQSKLRNQESDGSIEDSQPQQVNDIVRNSLSKIEESIEQSYTSSQKSQHVEQHQQLLNEIDKYLSKWNKRK